MHQIKPAFTSAVFFAIAFYVMTGLLRSGVSAHFSSVEPVKIRFPNSKSGIVFSDLQVVFYNYKNVEYIFLWISPFSVP